ncbi:hypothetical protein ALC57_14028, partial [Trachymyrmex cornetzi]
VAKGRLARTILSGPPQQPRCSGLKLEPPSAKGDLLVTSPLVPTCASGFCERRRCSFAEPRTIALLHGSREDTGEQIQ